MSERLNRAKELIQAPSESLSVEIKNWIDPEQPSGQAQIVRAAVALRNFDGGHLIIGFNDETRKPEPNPPASIEQTFHIDKIQRLITRHSSEPFEIFIDFPERDGQSFPVLTIPSGVKTPVVIKADLKDNNQYIIKQNEIYVRTLNSNYIPSSSKAGWKDWARLMEICFDNREADIGRFLRRHLGNMNLKALQDIFAEIQKRPVENQDTMNKRLEEYRQVCFTRATQVFAENSPAHGCFEAALFFDGFIPSGPTDAAFRQLLDVSNPHHTGWTPWFINHREGLPDGPRIIDGSWENLVIRQQYDSGIPEYMRLGAEGKFYHCRAFQEDYGPSSPSGKSPRVLDIELLIWRIAEIMSVGLSFARAMKCSSVDIKLCFLFRWSGLAGRRLVRHLPRLGGDTPEGGVSAEDNISSFVEVPLETPLSALGDYISLSIRPLCLAFGGHSIAQSTVEHILNKLLHR